MWRGYEGTLAEAAAARAQDRTPGSTLECKWDPRDGPDRNRSGVLSIGKAPLQQLLKADELLTLEVIEGVPHFR